MTFGEALILVFGGIGYGCIGLGLWLGMVLMAFIDGPAEKMTPWGMLWRLPVFLLLGPYLFYKIMRS